MPIYTNPIYINVRRRHYTSIANMKSDMSGRLQEWGYIEDDDYLGVLRSGASSSDWRWFSRSKLFEPATETNERITAGVIDIIVNEPGDDVNLRVESDTHQYALYMDGQYGNWGFHTGALDNWDIDNYHSIKHGDTNFSSQWYDGNADSGFVWNAYYDETDTRWEYRVADAAARIYSNNDYLYIQSAAAGAANGAITWVSNASFRSIANWLNPGGASQDTIVSTSGETYTLCIVGTSDNIGIGTANPLIDIVGDASFDLTSTHGVHILSDTNENAALVIDGWVLPNSGGPGGRLILTNRGGVANERVVSFDCWSNGLAKIESWDDDGGQDAAGLKRDDLWVISLSDGNIGIGTSTFQAACETNLAIKEGVAPGGATADQCYMWAQDDGGTAEMYVQDGGGVQTKISSHNDKGEWEIFYKDRKRGRKVRIDMEEFMKWIDKKFNTSFYHEEIL